MEAKEGRAETVGPEFAHAKIAVSNAHRHTRRDLPCGQQADGEVLEEDQAGGSG